MGLQLGTIQANLQEIYTSVHDDKSEEPPLVANLWGDRLYYSSAGWGRVWKWFYAIVGIFFGDSLRQNRLKQAMEKTHQLFQEQLKIIEAYIKQYQSYLKEVIEGYYVNEAEVAESRWAITDWNDSTRPFLKFSQKNENKKLSKLFQMVSGDVESGKPFHAGDLGSQAWNYQKIIDFEGVLNGPLPLKVLGMAATKKELNKEDAKQLGKWIKKINDAGSEIEVRKFHRVMKAVVEHLKKHHPSTIDAEVVNLELNLSARNCEILLQKDFKHLKWRESLKKGDVLTCNGKQYILGERIGQKAIGDDNNYIFEIENDKDILMMAGINEAVLALKQKLSEEYEWGIKGVEYKYIDPCGRFALVERLHDPLGCHQWTSTDEVITEEDQEVASPMAGLLDWMVQQEKTPLNFSPKYLMFDKDGQLKSLKVTMEKYKEKSEEEGPLKVEPDFDYNSLEQFAHECAGGNLRIYKYLMECSGLKTHKYAKYYSIMLENGLKGEKITAANQAGMEQITDPRIVDRGEALAKEAVLLREKCCLSVQKALGGIVPKNLKEMVDEKIVSFYEKNRSAGILWASMDIQVVSGILFEQTYT